MIIIMFYFFLPLLSLFQPFIKMSRTCSVFVVWLISLLFPPQEPLCHKSFCSLRLSSLSRVICVALQLIEEAEVFR